MTLEQKERRKAVLRYAVSVPEGILRSSIG